ncbi:unnamed protein product [Linum tenue]|uniref:Uncharacterized protein n=1 Tax=Linum tenue TaxID=586396 RepID=A0AAV0QN69_9ROSI|nr:unnamed protein product [Linum tenue]
MASRVGGGVAQVRNVDYKDWLNTDVSKPSKKGGGLGGRTPLGDLSNALKNSSSLNKTSKKQQQTGSGIAGLNGKKKTSAFGGGANAASGKTSVKASGNRKVLSDISNSSNVPTGSDISQKKAVKNSKRLSVVQEEDPMHPCAIAEEGFLHNHDECIKAQNRQMDLDEFLKILGLDKDCSEHFENRRAQVEPDSPKLHYELMEEEESWNFEFPTMRNLHSSPCSSPPSPKSDSSWLDCDHDFVNFQLTASP